eukprot:TRINITY_DN21915_c0_g1_i1.p1 TRINITY_DN21915_c0_g1~~TRINITY_DN21915_c0_g1_i1.p1  ORF type:complete len:1001 (+),score=135.69 TRINITY_DN21915_c0_g1_i1:83-3004(+)
MLSLRCLSIALSLACVLVGSFVAAFLAIQSGDDALSITKRTGSDAVEQCFATGSEGIVVQTSALIDALMSESQLFLDSFFRLPMAVTEIIARQLDELPPELAFDWPYLEATWMPQLWSLMHANGGRLTAVGIQTTKAQLLWVVEHDATVYAPPNVFHLYTGMTNNGTDYGPTAERTLWYDMGYGGKALNDSRDWQQHVCLGDDWEVLVDKLRADGRSILDQHALCYFNPDNPDPFFCGDSPADPHRKILDPNYGKHHCWCHPVCDPALYVYGRRERDPDGCPQVPWGRPRCVMHGYDPIAGTPSDFWLMGMLLAPRGTIMWSPPLTINSYLGIITAGAWGHPDAAKPPHNSHTAAWGGKAGMAWAGIDLRTVTNFLRQLALPGLSRTFLALSVDAAGSMLGMNHKGYLIAASHGAASLGDFNTPQEFIYPVNSTDAVIAATGAHILATGGGGLDDLRGYEDLFNKTGQAPFEFSAELPLDITGGRPSGPQRFFLKVEHFLDQQQKLGFWVVMSFDRYVILGSVDRKQEETKLNITAANKKVDDQLEEDRVLLYIVVTAVAVGMVILSVFFVIAIVRPLNMLGTEMEAVACMRLDDVTEQLSVLSEVARCQVAFLAMVRALRKYRDYMPLSLLQDDAEDDEEEEQKGAGAATDGSQSGSVILVRPGPKDPGRQGSAIDSSIAGSGLSASTGGVGQKRIIADKTLKGISRKQVSMVMIGVSRFHEALRGSDADVLATHTELFRTVVEAVGMTKAVPDTFCGDRIMVSFNAVRAAPGHRQACATLCDNIRHELDSHSWWQIGSAPAAPVVIGSVSGEVRCGNAGCPGMMRFTLFGKSLSWGWALQRYAQSLPQDGIGIYCDRWLAAEVEQCYELRTAALVKYPKRTEDVLVVSQLMLKRQVSENEWMYQLAEGADTDRYRVWNDVFGAVQIVTPEETKQNLEAVLQSHPHLQGDLAQRWLRILSEKTDIVDELRYH